MSGVGISFGADRIYDVLLETNKFPAELGGSTKLLFANFGEAEAMHCLKLLRTRCARRASRPSSIRTK
jgi:histidyl-tRNA synthetase